MVLGDDMHKTRKIKFIDSAATLTESFCAGRSYDVEETTAEQFVNHGIAELDEPEDKPKAKRGKINEIFDNHAAS